MDRAQPTAADGGRFRVGHIDLNYAESAALDSPLLKSKPGHPELVELEDVVFELLQTSEGLVAPRPGLPRITLTIADINSQPERILYASAVQAINSAIRDSFNRQGIVGVFVVPDEINIHTGQDLRPEGDASLTLRILTASVSDVRTLASGDRVREEDRLNTARHDRIRRGSPVRPATDEDDDAYLLNRSALDRYVLWLNRHPGRRVDVAVSPGADAGTAVLDYLVYESKPWSVYFQLSNTGTENTQEWRQRFGLIHNQLTGNDDTLLLDYITAGFEDAHAIVASYEAPFPSVDRLRWRIFGSYNEFTASDVGQARERFTGDGWAIGGALSYNIYQDRELFVDLYAGLRAQHVSINNEVVFVKGDSNFWFPQLGVQVDRVSETSSFNATLDLEAGFAEENRSELEKLGRLNPDREWLTLNLNASWSFFLEPLFFGEEWLNPDTPSSSTLAHELAFSLKGQYAFDYRLVPNFEGVVGGASTVRGYPESVVAADSVIVGSVEYRFHLPRSFSPEETPRRVMGRNFKFAPQQVYGRPDWDLVFSGFLDVARTHNSSRLSFERDETLVGAGVGVELQVFRNLIVSADWGFALEPVRDEVDRGDNRLHFVLTLMY